MKSEIVMSEYNFLQIDDHSYKSIKELYWRSFKLKTRLEEIKNKYDTSGFGLKNIGYLAKDSSGDLAAYYGVFPIRMSLMGKDILAAQSADTMTAPEHRKKGLFTLLAKKTYEKAAETGIRFVFGFPNDNSLPGFQRNLHWKFYGIMKTWKFSNKTLPVSELASRFRIILPLYQIYSRIRLKKYSVEMTQSNVEHLSDKKVNGQVKKDVHFVQYKTSNQNVHFIRMNGFFFLIKPIPHLNIGCFSNIEEEKTDLFLNTIKQLGMKLGCGKTVLTLSDNHWLYERLKSKVSFTDSLPIGYFEIDPNIPYKEITYVGADYDTF
jgi:GNAT superfamily N-acetyltransferase